MIKFLPFLFILTLINCEQKKVPAWDAQSQIAAAAEYKANQCLRECQTAAGADQAARDACFRILPFPPLLVLSDQHERNLNLCSIAITRTSCPLSTYPLLCLAIYLEEPASDIPPYIMFNDAAKRKF